MQYENKIQLCGVVTELNEVFRNDKGGIYEMILDLGFSDKYPINGLVKLTSRILDANKDVAVGAAVKIQAEATARIGKNGKWWGEITVRRIEVLSLPEKKQDTSVFDDDVLF
jgi:hypothetical protein